MSQYHSLNGYLEYKPARREARSTSCRQELSLSRKWGLRIPSEGSFRHVDAAVVVAELGVDIVVVAVVSPELSPWDGHFDCLQKHDDWLAVEGPLD